MQRMGVLPEEPGPLYTWGVGCTPGLLPLSPGAHLPSVFPLLLVFSSIFLATPKGFQMGWVPAVPRGAGGGV